MSSVIFFIAALGAIAGAMGVVVLRNPFYTVLALVCHLLSLAALFLLLRAEFVAAAQVVVYAGAVMVLYVFVVAYVGGRTSRSRPRPGAADRGADLRRAPARGAVHRDPRLGPEGDRHRGRAVRPGLRVAGQIGQLLLTKFLLAFEVASFLLLVAAVGAVILARRRGGSKEAWTSADEPEPPPDAGRAPPGVGSTAERGRDPPRPGGSDEHPSPGTSSSRRSSSASARPACSRAATRS